MFRRILNGLKSQRNSSREVVPADFDPDPSSSYTAPGDDYFTYLERLQRIEDEKISIVCSESDEKEDIKELTNPYAPSVSSKSNLQPVAKDLHALIDDNPKKQTLCYNIANKQNTSGLYHAALKQYGQCLKFSWNSQALTIIMNNMARCYFKLKLNHEALHYLNMACDVAFVKPRIRAVILGNKAIFLQSIGRTMDSIDALFDIPVLEKREYERGAGKVLLFSFNYTESCKVLSEDNQDGITLKP